MKTVNMKDEQDYNNTLLHYATQYQNFHMANHLLQRKARVYENANGESPLTISRNAQYTDSSFYEMTQLLTAQLERQKSQL